MKNSSANSVFLPGTNEQVNNLVRHIHNKFNSVLVIGSNSEEVAKILSDNYSSPVIIILEDEQSLLKARLILSNEKNVSVRLMDFDNTDFPSEKFDLIYVQASISNLKRNKIIKEIKRILKPGGFFCVGELTSKSKNPPAFIKDAWSASDISPIQENEISDYYVQRNFTVVYEKDLSEALKNFYLLSEELLNVKDDLLTQEEIKINKKFLKRINHEANIYLNLGGNDFMGFRMLILKKADIV
jgi:SAM-dependent methyltransferase